MNKPLLVYMLTLVGRLPHQAHMRMDVSLMHHVLNDLSQKGDPMVLYTSEMDREDCGVELEIIDWTRLETWVRQVRAWFHPSILK